MATKQKKYLLSVEGYLQMSKTGILQEKDRVELINGEIWSMSPIGSRHAYYVGLLTKYLILHFSEQMTLWIQSPLWLSEHSMPEPDLLLLDPNKSYEKDYPKAEDVLLVIEIADTSLQFDQTVKSTLYAQAGIPEYWIVNLQEERMEVYQKPLGEKFREKEALRLKESFFSSALKAKISFF